ncbi:MAG TPA: flagellar biosynthetic protein FliQ [bacterium]|nr:flagellar biosynthetic protein FliQ [bacterium]
MNEDYVIFIARETIKTAIYILAPILGAGLITGIVVSLFQTVTSIKEQTMTLIPKMAAVALAIVLLMPWYLDVILTFTQNIFEQISMVAQ